MKNLKCITSSLHKYRSPFLCLAILTITFLTFLPTLEHEFINYDDIAYVTQNEKVKQGFSVENIIWSFTTIEASGWFPFAWLSHMLDCQIYGLDPRGHHLTNLLFHLANTWLLYLFLSKTTDSVFRSAFVTALFALHPLHVEPVAWIAARKDLVSAFFFLLSMSAYIHYIKSPNIGRYFLVALFFIMCLLSKSSLVTLPFLLLLLDFWPLCRIQACPLNNGGKASSIMTLQADYYVQRLLVLTLEKVPLLFFSGMLTAIAFISAKNTSSLISTQDLSVFTRISNALMAYVNYIEKTIRPHALALPYPYHHSFSLWKLTFSILLLCIITSLTVYYVRRSPYLIVGWFWYIGTLVPVIGLVQSGTHSMADRYTYIPLIGLFIMITWRVSDFLSSRRAGQIVLTTSATIVICIIVMFTGFQINHWYNSVTLFQHTLKVTDNNSVAHAQLGHALSMTGKYDLAMFHYKQSLRLFPNQMIVYNNLGNILAKSGKPDEAISQYKKAITIDPDYINSYIHLGILMLSMDKPDDAIEIFKGALKRNPDHGSAKKYLDIAMQYNVSKKTSD